jgi:cholest-4-en-3-one 26-monooxygenase
MALKPTTLDEIDFWDLGMFTDGDPHAAWTLLRAQAPVWWHDRPGGEPFWCVSRYDDARAVHAEPVVFSSQAAGIMVRDDATLSSDPRGGAAYGIHPMIHTDPPRHAPLRKIISHNFTPKSIGELEQKLRELTETCLDEVADKREIDFVTDIAHRIPAEITFAMMDVPRHKWERLAELEHMTVTASDPEFQHHGDQRTTAAEASMELHGYFAELIRERIEGDGDDLLSQFLRGRIDGEPLSWIQVVAEAGLLLAGGLDTTRAAASAGAMLPLLERPEQLQALQDDPGLLPGAVEEFVRWASPVVSEARTATADAVIGGQPIAEGERVVIWVPSCNRDEAHFDDPFRYDIRRSPNRHLGFAHGEHFCLGAHLARLTLRIEFEGLLRRFSTFELIGEPKRVRSNFVGGLKHLPMRLTPR